MQKLAKVETAHVAEDELLTATLVAAMTGWSEAYVGKLLKRGVFPPADWQSGVRMFRRPWKRSTIERFLRERVGGK
jgi:hypothetical protein